MYVACILSSGLTSHSSDRQDNIKIYKKLYLIRLLKFQPSRNQFRSWKSKLIINTIWQTQYESHTNIPVKFASNNKNIPVKFASNNKNIPVKFPSNNKNLPVKFASNNQVFQSR